MAPRLPSARHAPPSSGLAGTGLAGTPRRLQDSPGMGLAGTPRRGWDARARDSRARQRAGHTWPSSAGHDGPGTPRRHPPGHNGPLPNGPSSERARHARRIQSDCPASAADPLGVGKPPNDSASAAPLVSVWRVEDVGERQLPGNVRAADVWSARSARTPEVAGGCALSSRQQAVADCRVNRAKPTSRASGVSCTP